MLRFNQEQQTQDFARRLAQCCLSTSSAVVIYLEGDLGAGKTTLARGFIQSLGFDRVKSPTYSIVESYQNAQVHIHHFDCYRLCDPEELEYIGIREYLQPGNIQLIEWPQMGQGMLAPADLLIKIDIEQQDRVLQLIANSTIGEQLLACLDYEADLSGESTSAGGS